MNTPKKTSHRSETDLVEQLAQALFGEERPHVQWRSRVRRKLPGGFKSALQDATNRAAVNARILPSEIVQGLDAPVAEAVLSSMSPECDVEIGDGRRVWVLGREPRRRVLARLAKQQRSHLISLIDRAPAHEWDDTGTYLQQLLRDAPLKQPSSLLKMRALAQAYDWLSGIVDVKGADQKLRQAMAFKSLLDEKQNLLKNGFFGRADELRTFDSFLAADLSGKPRPPVLSISGIGGSGKSAFLAFVTSRLLQQREHGGPAIFQVDFDRFGLGPNSIIELTFEITRQIALYVPAAADRLAALRARMRVDLAATGKPEARRSFESSLMRSVAREISSDGWEGRDVLLVLDTFEELQAKGLGSATSSGGYATDRIVSWIGELATETPLKRLRVVVSGRSPIEGESRLARLVVDKIKLDDLEPRESVRLLTNAGLSADIASALREAIGGNPLMLVIAARLMRRLTRDKRAEVLDGLGKETATLDKELVQGVLYGRILDHIHDKKARKLAHPGLVLRRVSWRLVRDVLAKPCGLSDISEQDAKSLVDALGNEVWLVERDLARPDVLVHRSDIRRMMVRLMAKEDRQPSDGASTSRLEQLRAIHREALDFYLERRDPTDNDSVREGEAFYHRMMLVDEVDAGKVNVRDVERIAGTFGGDADLLTPSLRLRVRQMREEPLSIEDAAGLPEEDWRLWAHREARIRLDQLQEPLAALAVIERRPVAQSDEAPTWQLRALDASARWDGLSDWWLQTVRMAQSVERSQENWARHSAAKALLLLRREHYAAAAVVMNGVLVEMRNVIRNMAREQGNLADHVRCANYALLARREFNRTHPWEASLLAPVKVDWPFEELPPAVDTYELDLELRRYIALNWHPDESLPIKRLGFTAFVFVPDKGWLEAIAELLDAPHLSNDLSGLQDGIEIAEILGRLAPDFSIRLASLGNRGTIARKPPHNFDPRLLCGEYPEMRPAAKFALRQAFPSSRDLRWLAELTQPILPIKPRDLQPGSFADNDLVPGQAVSLLVDYADRSRVLAKVMDAAAAARPQSEVLRKVANSVAGWESMFSRSVAASQTERTSDEMKQDLNRWRGLPYVERATAEPNRSHVDLSDRLGYDSGFLGVAVPEPKLSDAVAADANHAPLRYCRFSILMSRRSRLPLYAAAHLGSERQWGLPQSLDLGTLHGQIADPRLPLAQQSLLKQGRSFAFAIAPEVLSYGDADEAIRAIGDTRFAPNHIPLQKNVPDDDTDRLWRMIEQQLTGFGGQDGWRIALFTGVVQERDLHHWKVVVRRRKNSRLVAAAFSLRPDDRGAYAICQIRLKNLEEITGLNFGLPADAESLTGTQLPVSSSSEIRLPD